MADVDNVANSPFTFANYAAFHYILNAWNRTILKSKFDIMFIIS